MKYIIAVFLGHISAYDSPSLSAIQNANMDNLMDMMNQRNEPTADAFSFRESSP